MSRPLVIHHHHHPKPAPAPALVRESDGPSVGAVLGLLFVGFMIGAVAIAAAEANDKAKES